MNESRVKCLNPWDPQSKRQYSADGIWPCLDAGEGGGGQAHGVLYPVTDVGVLSLEGNGSRKSHQGPGWSGNGKMYTLNTIEVHAVCYALDALSSNSMKSSNPHSGFHETKVAKCLDTGCCDPTCNQGGIVVCVTPSKETP